MDLRTLICCTALRASELQRELPSLTKNFHCLLHLCILENTEKQVFSKDFRINMETKSEYVHKDYLDWVRVGRPTLNTVVLSHGLASQPK